MEHPINSNNPFADNEMPLHMASYTHHHHNHAQRLRAQQEESPPMSSVPTSISGLVVEHIVAIDVTRVRFPADAICPILHLCTRTLGKKQNLDRRTLNSKP